jgi:hypothetical protein
LLIATALLVAGPVVAVELDKKITNLDGTAIVDDKGKEMDLTIRTVIINALMSPRADKQDETGVDKVKRAELARRVLQDKDGSYKYTAEEIALMKELINKNYPSPLVVDQAWRALESNK